jgi:hypothetical protein
MKAQYDKFDGKGVQRTQESVIRCVKTRDAHPCQRWPPRNLTLRLGKALETEMLRACAEVTAKHGLVADGLAMLAMDLHWNFEFGVLVSSPQMEGHAAELVKTILMGGRRDPAFTD